MLAFRGEIEAQGRGSLHPHILMWLLGGALPSWLVALLKDEGSAEVPLLAKDRMRNWRLAVLHTLETRLRLWPSRTMKCVSRFQVDSVQWAASKGARRFGSVTEEVLERVASLSKPWEGSEARCFIGTQRAVTSSMKDNTQ